MAYCSYCIWNELINKRDKKSNLFIGEYKNNLLRIIPTSSQWCKYIRMNELKTTCQIVLLLIDRYCIQVIFDCFCRDAVFELQDLSRVSTVGDNTDASIIWGDGIRVKCCDDVLPPLLEFLRSYSLGIGDQYNQFNASVRFNTWKVLKLNYKL